MDYGENQKPHQEIDEAFCGWFYARQVNLVVRKTLSMTMNIDQCLENSYNLKSIFNGENINEQKIL